MKNLVHLWSLICEKVLVDAETNNISIIHSIDRFTVNISAEEMKKMQAAGSSGFSLPIPYNVVTVYRKTTDSEVSFSHRISLHNPKGSSIASATNESKIEKHLKTFRVKNQMKNLLVDESGVYSIRVEVKEMGEKKYSLCHEIPFEVQINYIDSGAETESLKTKVSKRKAK